MKKRKLPLYENSFVKATAPLKISAVSFRRNASSFSKFRILQILSRLFIGISLRLVAKGNLLLFQVSLVFLAKKMNCISTKSERYFFSTC